MYINNYDAWTNGYIYDYQVKISKYNTESAATKFRVINTGLHMMVLCALEYNNHVQGVFMLSCIDSLVVAHSSSYGITITRNAESDFTINSNTWSSLLVIDFSGNPYLTTVSVV